MNLVKKIGRHEFPILSVVANIKQDDGTYEFVLPFNVRVNLTEDEKREYDEAVALHNETMRVLGICKAAGLRG
jgi:hypothetical protein